DRSLARQLQRRAAPQCARAADTHGVCAAIHGHWPLTLDSHNPWTGNGGQVNSALHAPHAQYVVSGPSTCARLTASSAEAGRYAIAGRASNLLALRTTQKLVLAET